MISSTSSASQRATAFHARCASLLTWRLSAPAASRARGAAGGAARPAAGA
jgi:hypothetical protein